DRLSALPRERTFRAAVRMLAERPLLPPLGCSVVAAARSVSAPNFRARARTPQRSDMEEFRFGGTIRVRSTAPPRWFLRRLLAIRLLALLARRELSSPRVAERANSRRQTTRRAAEHRQLRAQALACLERRGTR